MNKRTIIVFLLLMGTSGWLRAQQTPQFTHYLFNHFGIHPAIAGSRPCTEIRMGYRTQWLNFPGAPKTAFANFHARLQPSKRRRGGRSVRQGVGLNVESDQMGPFGITRFQPAYAVHVPFSRRAWLAFGIGAGIEQWRIDGSKLIVWNYDDPALGSGSKFTYPTLSPSLWLYSDEYFGGLTLQQIFPTKIRVIPGSNLKMNLIFTGGKKFELERDKALIPSIAFKWSMLSAPAIDLNLLFNMRDKFILGASYRNTDALALMFRVNFWHNFSLGYSFDFTTSKIRPGTYFTHEVIVGIHTCKPDKRNSTECPVF